MAIRITYRILVDRKSDEEPGTIIECCPNRRKYMEDRHSVIQLGVIEAPTSLSELSQCHRCGLKPCLYP